MWIVCLQDDSHEIPNLFSQKKKTCRLLQLWLARKGLNKGNGSIDAIKQLLLFNRWYFELFSRYKVGLKLLLQCISEAEKNFDVVYKF